MKKKYNRKTSAFILCMALIAAMALFTAGCNGGTGSGDSGNPSTAADADSAGAPSGGSGQEEPEQLGEGSTVFLLVLWGAVMLLPKKMPPKVCPIVYMTVCALHGFLFGTLYAPAQAILYGLSLKGMVAWIVAGLPWDCIHGISNFFCGILIMPVILVLRLAERIGH